MELDLQLFGGRGGSSGVATAGGGSSMQDTYGQMAESKQARQIDTAARDSRISDYIESVRGDTREHGAFFDAEGNVLMQGTRTRVVEHTLEDGTTVSQTEMNFSGQDVFSKVTTPARRGEQISYVSVSPSNSVFAPDEIDRFKTNGVHSISTVTKNGTTYTLTRSSDKADPGRLGKAYSKESETTFNSAMSKGSARMAEALTNSIMKRWLRDNAGKYGFTFTETKSGGN